MAELRGRDLAFRLLPRGLVALFGGWSAAAATLLADRAAGLELPFPTGNVQALLAALTGALLTLAVFALFMRTVMVGLAAGPVSPRVVASYLDDVFQRRLTAWMIAALGYTVAVVAVLPVAQPAGGDPVRGVPAISALASVAVVVAALMAVLLAIRHAVTSLSPSHLVRALTDQALRVMRVTQGPDDPLSATLPGESLFTVPSEAMGWVQDIDHDALIDGIPPQTTIFLHTSVGQFVAPGELLASTDRALGDDELRGVRSAVKLATTRDAARDLAFAIQQLVDVAQHALSPASNDTSTGEEALVHLRAVFHALLRQGTSSGCLEGDQDRHVVSLRVPHPADHLDMAFERLRRGAMQMPTLVDQMVITLEALEATAEEVGDRRSVDALRQQRTRLFETAETKEIPVRRNRL